MTTSNFPKNHLREIVLEHRPLQADVGARSQMRNVLHHTKRVDHLFDGHHLDKWSSIYDRNHRNDPCPWWSELRRRPSLFSHSSDKQNLANIRRKTLLWLHDMRYSKFWSTPTHHYVELIEGRHRLNGRGDVRLLERLDVDDSLETLLHHHRLDLQRLKQGRD